MYPVLVDESNSRYLQNQGEIKIEIVILLRSIVGDTVHEAISLSQRYNNFDID